MKKIYETDPWLAPFKDAVEERCARIDAAERAIIAHCGGRTLRDSINNHLYYGLHRTPSGGWVIREWAPNATRIFLIGDFNNWHRSPSYALSPIGSGNWELYLDGLFLGHGDLYKLYIEWPGGGGERIPAYCTRLVQDPDTKVFSAQVWDPPHPYRWVHPWSGDGTPGGKRLSRPHPLVYECHVGMSSERPEVATFDSFREEVLPRVKALGYDTLQIMALQEHPYYGSFGYQVSNFFALSSRFGTPEQFKRLVDAAHGEGIAVVMDMVQSHSVDNENEGLSRFDGRDDLYFYPGPQGHHPAWGSRCFDYGKPEVVRFLLSCCKFWLEEYHLDGFRFDGVTSMLYWDHGLGRDFSGYDVYFGDGVDANAVTYLGLANRLVRQVDPLAVTIAEDVSGMPGLAAPAAAGGIGFGFRLSMGVADCWIKWIKERPDETWSPGEMWYELTNKRSDEKTVGYAECHDQALVGDKTLLFRLLDKAMYDEMDLGSRDPVVDRGIALHKLIRLVTMATAGDGYLNFMGNEFGHPEWIDFPREGNGWSFAHARRQWSLADDPALRYRGLQSFDRAMVRLARRRNLFSAPPVRIRCDEDKKLLVFRRKDLIFAMNFHPDASFTDEVFEVPAGTYAKELDSDDTAFGGFGRLATDTRHDATDGLLRLYLPSRCALVLRLEKKKM